MELEHHERRAWVEQIAGINRQLNNEEESQPTPSTGFQLPPGFPDFER